MTHHQEKHEVVPYGTYILVWLSLIILTGLTVAIAGVNLKGFGIVGALIIATIKSALVVSIFMHLKYETGIFKIFFYIVAIALVIFLILTFSDYLFR